ncbi:MAG TPA: hypothetical protein EYH04_05930 [Archaeoglobus profundus]|nr:hypothetical protein [Archaeoglobus profundus]
MGDNMGIEVILVPNGEWKKFEDFLKNLDIKYRVEKEKLQIRPALILRKNNCEIVYHALPIGTELEPFLKTLKILSNVKCEAVNGEIMVFITPTCPICANVVEIVNKVAINKGFKSIIIDATIFPNLAQKFEITAVPTIIINGKIKVVGSINEDELINLISKSNYKDYIVKLLKEGRIEDVKDLAKSSEVVKILAELLAFPDFMVRLGAMVILEQLHPNLIGYAKEEIRKLLKHKDNRIREDVAMLLGEIGDEEDISYLEELMNDEDKNVVEAAMEAIEKIKSRLKISQD